MRLLDVMGDQMSVDVEKYRGIGRPYAIEAAYEDGYQAGLDEIASERDDLQSQVDDLQGEINALRKRLGEEDELLALRELFYCVKDHLRGCGDPHKFKRAFDRVQAELNEPMMHVA